MAPFSVCFSIRKNFKKRKLVERLPLIQLAYFMYKYKCLQAGQLSQEYLSFLQHLLNFIITKYLKQEVDANVAPVASL